jgi:hypothetical protein
MPPSTVGSLRASGRGAARRALRRGRSWAACRWVPTSRCTAVQAPDVAALLVEMPVLEWATPAAASLFVPLVAVSSRAPPVRLPDLGWSGFRAPGTMRSTATSARSTSPGIAAVLHGIPAGPVSARDRGAARDRPRRIIGHENDLIHPFRCREPRAADPGGAPRQGPIHGRAAAHALSGSRGKSSTSS